MLGPTTRANVHVPTVLAIGVVCFAAVTVIHEALGHGLACLLVGGKALAVSSTELRCDGPEDGAHLVVTAAGVGEQERETRMRLLTRLPLAAALVVSLAAGLLSPLQPRYALVTSLIAPLVLVLLVRLPSWPESDPPASPVRIASWAGVVVGLGFVLVLGPGLGSFAGYTIAR